MTELFHSTDLGESWNIIDFRQLQSGNIYCNVQFTSDPAILYTVGVRSDGGVPMKSTDGGVTWKPLAGDPTGGGAYFLFADPNNTTSLILTDYSTLYYSSDGGGSFQQKYTDNSGAGCYVAGAFFDDGAIYVGTNKGLLVSSNGGGTFAMASVGGIPAAEAMVSYAGAKQNGTTRFLCVTLGSGDVYPGVTGADHPNYQNIYALDYGAASWSVKGSGIPSGNNPFFVGMARNNIDVAYVAGGSDNSAPIVFKTTNGGGAWGAVFLTANNQNIKTGWSGSGGDRDWSYGEYALGFAVSPIDPNRVVITDLGFAHVTADGGTSWKQAYVATAYQNAAGSPTPTGKAYGGIGLENTTCWRVAWIDSLNIFSCFSDIKGILSNDAGNSWSQNYTGHTLNSMYYVVKNPATGTVYGATSSVHDMYQSTTLVDTRIDAGKGQVLFSTDKGHTWGMLHDFGHPVIWLALDPNDAGTLYASVIHSTQGGIYVSHNIAQGAASTWTRLAAPPRTEGHPFNIHVLNDGTLVCSYSGRRASNAFTNSSGVFASTDGGTTWQDRSSPQMLYWTKDVVIDPYDAAQKTWYAAVFSGYGGAPNSLGGLYKTVDRGITWSLLLSLPSRATNEDRVTSCTVSPADANEMYVTTETDGLWYTKNLRSATPTFTQLSNYPFRQPERVFYNPYKPDEVWVTSFGNGMRVGSTATLPTPPPAPLLVSPANLSTNVPINGTMSWQPVSGATGYHLQMSTFPDFNTTVVDQSGLTGTSRPYTALTEGTRYYWRVSASNSAGEGSWSEVWNFQTVPSGGLSVGSQEGEVAGILSTAVGGSGAVTVRYATAGRGALLLEIFDPLGHPLFSHAEEYPEPGQHIARFDVTASGLYICRLNVGGRVYTSKVVVAK
jgi:photosystem II stability/assembly factor-like uncharacterized protein